MEAKTFVEWLNHEIELIIGDPVKFGSLQNGIEICQKAYDVIKKMSIEEKNLVNSRIHSYWYQNYGSLYGDLLPQQLEDHLGAIFTTIFGFLE